MMADETTITTETEITAEVTTEEKPLLKPHGLRIRDEDWDKWQKVVRSYSSAADAFASLVSLAQMRAAGEKAGMSAKVALVDQHTRQIAEIYTEMLTTMEEQCKLAEEKLDDADHRHQVGLKAAHDAEEQARADARAAREEAAEAKQVAAEAERAKAAARAERDIISRDLDNARQDLASSRELRDQARADASAARLEVQSLREANDRAKAEITDLRAQLADARTTITEETTARKLADGEVTSLTAQLAAKDALIQALQAHVASLTQQLSTYQAAPINASLNPPDTTA